MLRHDPNSPTNGTALEQASPKSCQAGRAHGSFVIVRRAAGLELACGSYQDRTKHVHEREAAMRARLLPLFALALLSVPLAGASAESLQDNTKEAERLANEALTNMMRALDLLIMTVPRAVRSTASPSRPRISSTSPAA
jgi:hypothetical protein